MPRSVQDGREPVTCIIVDRSGTNLKTALLAEGLRDLGIVPVVVSYRPLSPKVAHMLDAGGVEVVRAPNARLEGHFKSSIDREDAHNQADTLLGSFGFLGTFREYAFTEIMLYGTPLEEAAVEFLRNVEFAQRLLSSIAGAKFVLNDQGASIYRRTISLVARHAGIRTIYFGASWIPGRLFLHSDDRNLVSGYSPIPVSSIDQEYLDEVRAAVAPLTQARNQYAYRSRSMIDGRMTSRLSAYGSRIRSPSFFATALLRRIRRAQSRARTRFVGAIRSVALSNSIPEHVRHFVFFPLHYQLDSQLTLRARHLFRQAAVVEYLAWSLPADTMLVVKEHPHAVGGIRGTEWHSLRRAGNVMLASHELNTHEILEDARCSAVVVINSSVGFEALLHRVPCICLSTFYGIEYPPVLVRTGLEELPRVLADVMQRQCDDSDFEACIASIYGATVPGAWFGSQHDLVRLAETLSSSI